MKKQKRKLLLKGMVPLQQIFMMLVMVVSLVACQETTEFVPPSADNEFFPEATKEAFAVAPEIGGIDIANNVIVVTGKNLASVNQVFLVTIVSDSKKESSILDTHTVLASEQSEEEGLSLSIISQTDERLELMFAVPIDRVAGYQYALHFGNGVVTTNVPVTISPEFDR